MKVLIVEILLFLVPITLIDGFGLLWMLLLPVSDIRPGISLNQLAILLTYMAQVLPAGLSLMALWAGLILYIGYRIPVTFKSFPIIHFFILIGIFLSIVGFCEAIFFDNKLLYSLLNSKYIEIDKTLSMFIFGLPACVPAVHLLISSHYSSANKSLKDAP